MKEIAKFYKGKKVFITGATGFKGSWLSYILKNFGSKVYSYSLKPHTKPSNFNLLKLDKKINCIYKDVRDKKVLQRALKTIDPDIIFHLAAQPLVKKSYKEPLTTFETNINGTINILESSRSLKKLKSLVIITSDKCYKNVEKKNGYSETDELGGIDPYSASKAAAENVCFSYLKSFYMKKKIGFVTARAGNVIGGGDWSEDRIIPDFIKSIKNNKKFYVRSPNAVRPWQHIFDLCYGYLLLGKRSYGNSNFNGSWNFGPNKKNTCRVIEIIKAIDKNINSKKKMIIKKNKSLKETKILILKSEKSKKILNWKMKFTIHKSLLKTSEWYNCYLKNEDIRKLSYKQFSEYFL